MLREITLVLAVLGLIPALGFIALYGTTSPWWRSPGGRHLMSFAVAALLLFLWWSLEILIGSYPGRQVLRFVVAASFVTLMWWRLFALVYLHFGLLRKHFNGDSVDSTPRRRASDPPPCGASTLGESQAEEREDARGRHTTEP